MRIESHEGRWVLERRVGVVAVVVLGTQHALRRWIAGPSAHEEVAVGPSTF